MTSARATAFEILRRCEKDKAYANLALSAELDKTSLSASDRAFVTELVYGTLSHKLTLEYCIAQFSDKPLEKLELSVKLILEMALYQLRYLTNLPHHAVCNEAVLLTNHYCHKGVSGFVNAILRTYLRAEGKVDFPDENTAYGLSVRYSVSKDAVMLLKEQYGLEKTKEILTNIPEHPAVYVTVNTCKTTAEEVAEELGGEAVDFATVRINKGHLSESKAYKNGLFFVQDLASSMAVSLLDPKEGDTVFDLCSAPGGKSLKAGILMKNKGMIYAFDLHSNKLSLIRDSAKRLGLSIIKTECADATLLQEKMLGKADCIICDVPCSGLGVMAKKPEIRYKSSADIASLYDVQQKILQNAGRYLKPGGRLLYSTCSINPLENEKQVEKFLKENPQFSCVERKTLFPTAEHDGFFMAVLTNDRH